MKFITMFILLLSFISCSEKIKIKKNELNIALNTNIPTIDPAVAFDEVSSVVVNHVYESLFEYDYLIRPYKLKPLLAEQMPIVEENGLKYTIKIKKNIYYHKNKILNENRTVTAQDIINQFRRTAFAPIKSNGWWLFSDRIVGLDEFRENAKNDFSNFYTYPIDGLKAIDDHTLVIKLKKPFPQILYALSMSFVSPIPKEIIDYYKNDLTQHAIGTGPYYLDSWQRGAKIVLKKFENYHSDLYPETGDRYAFEKNLLKDKGQKLPFIETVNLFIMKEAQTKWLNFRSGKLDYIILEKDHFSLALGSDGRVLPEMRKKGISLQMAPTLTYWWLSFNMLDPIVGKNKNLRKAIAHAIDTKKYIKTFTNNIALQANSIYPPGVPGYNPSNKLPYSYNLDKAKKYLELAGYPNGKGLPTITYDVRGSNSTSRQQAEFIKLELAKIGINVNITLNSFAGFLQKVKTGKLQFWLDGWIMDYPDAENTTQLLLKKNFAPGPNVTNFSNPEIEELFKIIAYEKNPMIKKEAMSKVENIVHENLPWIMQYYQRKYILHYDYVKNFRHSDLVNNSFKYLRIDNE